MSRRSIQELKKVREEQGELKKDVNASMYQTKSFVALNKKLNDFTDVILAKQDALLKQQFYCLVACCLIVLLFAIMFFSKFL